MNFLKNYNENVVEYDLINKFNYKILNKIPKLKSITLTFKLKKSDTKTLISSLAALKLLSQQNPTLNCSKVSNISFNIRKGQPVGCKVNLKKKFLRQFLNVLINDLSGLKKSINRNETSIFSFKISNILVFHNLEKNYQFFKNLSDLNITVTTINCKNNELGFLLKANKLLI